MLRHLALGVIVHRDPRSMPLAMFAEKKEMHGFLFLCMHMIPGDPFGVPTGSWRVSAETSCVLQFSKQICIRQLMFLAN